MQPRQNGPVSADKWTEHMSHGAPHANQARYLEMQETWPAECNWQMSPSITCGKSGSEGPSSAATALLSTRLACTYVQHGHLGLDENLRQIIGIRWPHRISNDALYRRTQSSPISAAIRAARWSLFGHVLRLPLDVPVQRDIDAYLEDTGTPKFRGRPPPRCTLATTLGENLRRIGRQLRNSDDVDALHTLDRRTWRDLGRELA